MAGVTMASVTFVSCTDYSIMDDNVIRMGLFGEEYSENFQKAYGAINPKQTWDFSLMGLRSNHLEGGPTFSMQNNGATRAADNCNGPIFGATAGDKSEITKSATGAGDYTVQQTTLTWMNTQLNEKHDHRDLGAPFKLVKQAGHDFLIIPIYQGHSNQECDLHLVAKDNSTNHVLKDYMIWTKSQDIKYTQDFTRTGGEEYFYPASGAYGSNRTYDDSDNRYRYLNLGVAYADILHSVQNWNTFKVHITVPAGGKITGAFGDVSDNNKDNFSDFNVDNTSGSAPKTQTIDLSSCFGDKIQNNGTFTNFGIKKVTLTDCVFDTYDEDKRVRVSLELNDNNSNSQLKKDIDISDKVKYADGHTDNRYNVRSTPIRINCDNIQEDFFFYLDMTYGEGQYNLANTGTKQRSDEGMMLALMDRNTSAKFFDSAGLENLKTQLAPWLSDETGSNWEYFLIGAEDANLKNSDWDMNDVVFLIAAKTAPKIKELVKKRYMIEDLGSTYDFDFNDIVLDVTQETLTNVGTGEQTITSTANLAHLCGTIPFKIEIGDGVKGYKVLGEDNGAQGKFPGQNGNSEIGGLGFDPTTSHTYDKLMNVDVTGFWDPEKNNIRVTVWPKENTASWNNNQSSEGLAANAPNGMTYHFPAPGETPFMIAVDQTVGWTHESMTIPHEWFNTWTWTTDFDPDNNLQGGIEEKVDDNIHPIKWFTPVSYVVSNDVYCTMTADDMAQISVGDDIVIYYESAATGTANLKVVSGDMNYTQQHSSTLSQASGSITINVTSTNIDALKRGIAIMGNGYTLTQVKHKRITNVDWGKVNGDNGFVYDSELLSYAKISSSKLTNVKVGDRLTFSVKDVKGAAKVQLQAMGGTDSWKAIEALGGEQSLEGKTNFTLTVTSDNIDYVKNGLAIQGYNFTLTRIQREGSIDFNEEANFVMSASDYDNQITISGESVVNAGVAVNDDIIITLKDVNGSKRSAQVQHTNPWENISGYSSDWNNSKITFKVTDADMLTKLQSGGFAIQGYGYTVVKVTKVTPAIVANITLGQACSFAPEKWADSGRISASQFQAVNAAAGDKLVITLSNVQSSAVIAIKKMADNWPSIDGENHNLSAGATTFELILTDEYATALKNNGAAIQGVGFTVTSVELRKGHDLTTDTFESLWGDNSVNGKSAEYKATWSACGWNPGFIIDCSSYSKVVVRLALDENNSSDFGVQLAVQYDDKNPEDLDNNNNPKPYYSVTGFKKGVTEFEVDLDSAHSSGVVQIYLQCNGTLGKLTVLDAFLVAK
ncbi:MAG: hypothetical protein Q4E60_08605 [Bacteroidales bacterium]|nr:hypothetical protein [Bacteroidales bacterium]